MFLRATPRPSLAAFFPLVFLLATSLSAQVQTGVPPFGSFGGGPDVINAANANVHLQIPIRTKTGRGLPFFFELAYDSSIWSPHSATGSSAWTPAATWGWSTITNNRTGYVFYTITTNQCPYGGWPPTGWVVWNVYRGFWYVDSFGTPHPFSLEISTWPSGAPCGSGPPGSGQSVATDASGYTLSATASSSFASGTVYSSSGSTFNAPFFTAGQTPTPQNGSVIDRNGNKLSSSVSGGTTTYTDTLGTVPLTVSGSGTPASPLNFTYTAPSGGFAIYSVKYTAYSVQTNFGCSGVTNYGPTTNNLVSEVDLPDNSKYTFTYEATPGFAGKVTGRVASITLPTGGTITYTYTGGSSGHITCADGSASGLTRAVNPGGTWTYTRTAGTGAAYTTKINDPQGNDTLIQFQGLYETQRQVYQGLSTSGTLLTTINTCYNGATSPCTGTGVFPPIIRRTQIVQIPDSSGKQSKNDAFYNSYGMPYEQDDYDFGSGAVGSLLRKTLITYAGLGNHISAFPQTVTIQDSSGVTKAQTTYCYDEATPSGTPTCGTTGSPTAISGTPQHVAVSGSRGNATTIARLVVGTSTLGTKATYYDTGMLKTSTDVNGAVTTYNYPDATSTCGNTFPTSVNEPSPNVSLSRSFAWNCTGGVQASLTDENGKIASTTYTDAYFWRPNSATDQLGNQTVLTYQPNPSYCCPWMVSSSLTFNGGNSVANHVQYKDGLGRTYVDQRQQSPSSSTLDSVSYTFDSVGRLYSASMPCSISSAQTCTTPTTTQTYDALNRPLVTTNGGGGTVTNYYTQNDVLVTASPAPSGENTKRRQFERDALGRITSVCEVSGASGSGSCGQSNAQTGFLTKYTYDALGNLTSVTQNAQPGGTQQTRSYSFDALSRLTAETNPESGTTTYVYDSDASCGTSNGDTVKKTNAASNVTCMAYDALHRRTMIWYPSGPNSSSSAMKVFYYDASHFNTTSNTKGRLASAGTCLNPTCAGPWITGEDFSYSARGELSDFYELTPNSGGWYHITQTYWANGALNQLSGLANLPTITYGVDGEGRTSTVSASSGQNPVTATTYNIASLPTSVSLGSGDSDAFTYDPNTNRMTQYKFNVNGQAVIANLTWNANGTLQTQNITDPFNSANTQNCSYSYDDLTRLTTANCGTAANQSFSYDPFGNINKTGSPYSFQPTYSSSTNRMTNISGFTPSYDANGNILNDNLHAYAWNADGQPTTIDSVGLTYDALGRMVEQNRSGAYTQIVYAPGGQKFALMNGQTLQKAYVPLPGTATAVYTATAPLDHYRRADWLGNVRLGTQPYAAPPWAESAYAPFGEPYAQSGATDLSFTGQNSDTVSGDYDFLYREYSFAGRWVSPDPAGLAAVDPSNPQSWNRYSYVLNNPVNLTDPTGLWDDVISTPGYGYSFDSAFFGSIVGGGYSAGGWGASGNCVLDGIPAPCDMVMSRLTSGSAVQCPNNLCSGFNSLGSIVRFVATELGAAYVCSAAGTYGSQQDAGVAAAVCGRGLTAAFGTEYGGVLYRMNDTGQYSFVLPNAGYVSQYSYDPTTIPDGTVYAGFYHTHPRGEFFSGVDITNWGLALENVGFPTYLGTPHRILMFDPQRFGTMPNGCVLFGPPVPSLPGYLTTPVPACH